MLMEDGKLQNYIGQNFYQPGWFEALHLPLAAVVVESESLRESLK